MKRMFEPAHPGEVLREFLPADMTVTEAVRRLKSRALNCPGS